MRYLFLVLAMLATGAPAFADGNSGHGHETAKENSVKLELLPEYALASGKTVKVTAKLTSGSEPITLDKLKEVHTKKLHLLVIDKSLSDYHHIHPVQGKNAGEYVFDFKPLKNGVYSVWADITPVSTGEQEYVKTEMGTPVSTKPVIDKKIVMVSDVDGYNFTLKFDNDLKAGEAVMGNLTVTKGGKPFKQLQPIMGAFAHIVGFTEDSSSVLHIHPMGKEPTSDKERGGDKLQFHMELPKAGLIKMFAQVRINEKEIFAPFSVMVSE